MMFLKWLADPLRHVGRATGHRVSDERLSIPPPARFGSRWGMTDDGHPTFTLDKLCFTIFPARTGWRYAVEALDHNRPGAYAESRTYMTENAAKVGALKEYLRRTEG